MTHDTEPGPETLAPRGVAMPEHVYETLRRIARRETRGGASQLDATDVLHTAWLQIQERLAHLEPAAALGLFAVVMRRILVDEARRRTAQRMGSTTLLALADGHDEDPGAVDLERLDLALDELRRVDARWAQIVELRYFGGATEEHVAEALGLARRTVSRDWKLARAWLRRWLTGGAPGS